MPNNKSNMEVWTAPSGRSKLRNAVTTSEAIPVTLAIVVSTPDDMLNQLHVLVDKRPDIAEQAHKSLDPNRVALLLAGS